MYEWSKHILSFFFIFLFSFHPAFTQQYNFRQYSVDEGLAHSQVSCIYQDSKGYMWFTTYGGGISKFDGKSFTNYTEKDGLPGNIVRPVTEDKQGNLWFGTIGGGLCSFDPAKKTFTALKDPSCKINEKIYTVIADKKGMIWFGADNGLYNYDPATKKVKHFTAKEGVPEKPVMSVFQDSKEKIWIAVWESGVHCYNGKNFRQYTEKNGLSYHTVMSVSEDSKGNIWLGTFKGATKGTPTDGDYVFAPYTGSALIDSSLIYKIYDDKRGHLWFGGQGCALIRYDQKTASYTRIGSKNGLMGDIVLDICPDREGNLWLSNWGFGAVQFRGSRFVRLTQKEGLPADVINSIVPDEQGNLIVCTGKGIRKLDRNYQASGFNRQFDSTSVTSALHDSKGNWWIAYGNRLYRLNGKFLKVYDAKHGFNSSLITSIAEDKQGNIWIGSWSTGLFRYDAEAEKKYKPAFTNYNSKTGTISDYIYTIYSAKDGTLWIGTWDGGLCTYRNGSFTTYKKEQGLPANNVVAVCEDSRNNLWAGTFGGGACCYSNKKFRTIGTGEGLSDNTVQALLPDGNNIWICTSKGLNRLDLKEFYSSGKTVFRFYSREDGFTGTECSNNCVYRGKNGKLFFGTKKGIAVFDPSEDRMNPIAPPVYINSVQLFFTDYDWKTNADSIDPKTQLPVGLRLDHTKNHLTFSYSGISTSIPEKIRYRYILEGADKDWSPPTDKSYVTYSGLAPGVYTFKVIACNNDGVYAKEPAVFSFSITPPFWQQAWFYIACGCIVIAGCIIYMKLRTRKLKAANKLLEEKVNERTAEVQKQKSELQTAYTEIEEKSNLLEQRNKEVLDSINYAKRIQRALLASDSMISDFFPENFVLYKPKDIVSGDFYWASTIKKMRTGKTVFDKNTAASPQQNTVFAMATGDCTGHGVPGAFMSLLNISYLNEAINEKKIISPEKVLNHIRHRLIQALSGGGQEITSGMKMRDGMDAVLCVFDKENMELQFAAANNPVWIIRNNDLIELKGDKMPVGSSPKESEPFTLQTFSLQKNDLVYTLTDGFADQFGGPKGKKFKYKQLQSLLLQLAHLPMQEQKEKLDAALEQWKKGQGKTGLEQVDDILITGIRI